jgi:hypothetical protein
MHSTAGPGYQLLTAVQRATVGTPYTVTPTRDGFDVHINLAEPRWYGTFQARRINRAFVHGVVEAPNGAHFTSCVPDYGRDEVFQRQYAEAAASTEAWHAFRARYLDDGEDAYQAAVAALREESRA